MNTIVVTEIGFKLTQRERVRKLLEREISRALTDFDCTDAVLTMPVVHTDRFSLHSRWRSMQDYESFVMQIARSGFFVQLIPLLETNPISCYYTVVGEGDG